MKKIGIVSLGYGWLPVEKGPSRFYYICKTFAKSGYDVELVTTGFQHFAKEPRDKQKILAQGYPFAITFIDVPGYKKNIDLARVRSNMVAAKKFYNYLKEKNDYDVIYCSIPSNRVAARVAQYCQENHVPLIVDIEDLWPEAMNMVIHNGLARKLLKPLEKDAEKVYGAADAVVGTSQEYTQRAFLHQHRNIPAKTVYVGCDLQQFDDGVKQYAGQIEKKSGEYWVMYTGSIGTSYNLDNLVDAAALLKKQGHPEIRFKLLGTGPLLDELKEKARNTGADNVEFLGYQAYPKMAAYLSKCDIAVNSFVKGAPQSIVNKVGDYLASGKPMINTLESEEFMTLVQKHDFGVNVAPGDPQGLADAIMRLKNDPPTSERMGKNARNTAEQYFDRAVSYRQMVDLADQLIAEKTK